MMPKRVHSNTVLGLTQAACKAASTTIAAAPSVHAPVTKSCNRQAAATTATHDGCHKDHGHIGDERQEGAPLHVQTQRQLKVGRQPGQQRVVAPVEAEVGDGHGPHCRAAHEGAPGDGAIAAAAAAATACRWEGGWLEWVWVGGSRSMDM